jgi:hypothetical protein
VRPKTSMYQKALLKVTMIQATTQREDASRRTVWRLRVRTAMQPTSTNPRPGDYVEPVPRTRYACEPSHWRATNPMGIS